MGLSAKNVSLTLGGAQVLDGVSVEVRAGEVLAICGPNGAGKSTLLSVLAGLIRADFGAVLLDGLALDELTHEQRARLLGYLPQDGEIAWDLAVENLAALGRLPHRDRDMAAVTRALAKTDMTQFAKRPVSTLSGGEKARALLARVLATQPRWLLADEPLAALDLAHRLTILALLRSEAAAGAGVAIVVHDLAQAMNHADQVAVLSNGKLAALGSPEAALTPALIAQVWGVSAQWLGEPGARALVTRR